MTVLINNKSKNIFQAISYTVFSYSIVINRTILISTSTLTLYKYKLNSKSFTRLWCIVTTNNSIAAVWPTFKLMNWFFNLLHFVLTNWFEIYSFIVPDDCFLQNLKCVVVSCLNDAAMPAAACFCFLCANTVCLLSVRTMIKRSRCNWTRNMNTPQKLSRLHTLQYFFCSHQQSSSLTHITTIIYSRVGRSYKYKIANTVSVTNTQDWLGQTQSRFVRDWLTDTHSVRWCRPHIIYYM